MKFNVDAIMQTMLDLYTYLLKSASKSKPGSDEDVEFCSRSSSVCRTV